MLFCYYLFLKDDTLMILPAVKRQRVQKELNHANQGKRNWNRYRIHC